MMIDQNIEGKGTAIAAKLRTYGMMLSVGVWTSHKNSHMQPFQRIIKAVRDFFKPTVFIID